VRVVLDALRRLAGPAIDPAPPERAWDTERERMASEIDTFVAALDQDLITADDFRR
jgi:hypothetical protein